MFGLCIVLLLTCVSAEEGFEDFDLFLEDELIVHSNDNNFDSPLTNNVIENIKRKERIYKISYM